MAVGVIAGFKETLVTTSVATQVTAEPCYVVARLASNTTNASTLSIYNGTTAAANEVSMLRAPAAGVDETGIPVRCDGGVRVIKAGASSKAFIGIR